MWYVIQTISGQEHKVCMWIHTYVDKACYSRCFVPLYEDVWRKEGIGHISIKKMFSGYLFLETDTPDKVHDSLKAASEVTILLSISEEDERIFLPLYPEEETFFDSILSDGMMRVSYIHVDRNRKLDTIIGPLRSYRENIVRLDLPHRRAIVELPVLGEKRRIKFGLWLDADPKIDWIETEKKKIQEQTYVKKSTRKEKKKSVADEEIYGYKVGDFVINTTGIYGDVPLEIIEIHPGKNSVVVKVLLFGNMTQVEMGMGEVEKSGQDVL